MASSHKARRSSPPPARPDDARLYPDASLLKVVVLFFVYYVVLQAASWMAGYYGLLDPLMSRTAVLAGACSSLSGVPATVSGNEVLLATRILRIDVDCTGLSLGVMYSALILAYPLSPKSKLIGLGVGLPVILLANMARLTAVAQLSGRLDDRTFLFVHDYLFAVLMVAVVISLWAYYLVRARRHAS